MREPDIPPPVRPNNILESELFPLQPEINPVQPETFSPELENSPALQVNLPLHVENYSI
jgi:hypothetical protein